MLEVLTMTILNGDDDRMKDMQRRKTLYDEAMMNHNVSENYMDLVQACASEDPAYRPSFIQILQMMTVDRNVFSDYEFTQAEHARIDAFLDEIGYK